MSVNTGFFIREYINHHLIELFSPKRNLEDYQVQEAHLTCSNWLSGGGEALSGSTCRFPWQIWSPTKMMPLKAELGGSQSVHTGSSPLLGATHFVS